MEYKGYFIFFEREGSSYGAYSPELPGMATVGETLSEVEQFVTEAIDLHIENTVDPEKLRKLRETLSGNWQTENLKGGTDAHS